VRDRSIARRVSVNEPKPPQEKRGAAVTKLRSTENAAFWGAHETFRGRYSVAGRVSRFQMEGGRNSSAIFSVQLGVLCMLCITVCFALEGISMGVETTYPKWPDPLSNGLPSRTVFYKYYSFVVLVEICILRLPNSVSTLFSLINSAKGRTMTSIGLYPRPFAARTAVDAQRNMALRGKWIL
jgi:hypothetical protein